MTVGEKMRRENKHRKIVLKREPQLGEDYRVVKVVNTLEVSPRQRVRRDEAQAFIDKGFTVEITG